MNFRNQEDETPGLSFEKYTRRKERLMITLAKGIGMQEAGVEVLKAKIRAAKRYSPYMEKLKIKIEGMIGEGISYQELDLLFPMLSDLGKQLAFKDINEKRVGFEVNAAFMNLQAMNRALGLETDPAHLEVLKSLVDGSIADNKDRNNA